MVSSGSVPGTVVEEKEDRSKAITRVSKFELSKSKNFDKVLVKTFSNEDYSPEQNAFNSTEKLI